MSRFVSVIMAVRLSTQRVWHTFNYDWKRANVVIAYLVNEAHVLTIAYRLDTPIDKPADRPYRASARSMDLLVSFHSQCRGMKFYDLRSAGAEWGTKLKLVKEPTTPHNPLCVTAWVTVIPGERGTDGARPLRRTSRTRRRETLYDTFVLPNS